MADKKFKKAVPWKPGERVDSVMNLNSRVDVTNRLIDGIIPPQQLKPGGSGLFVRRFRIVSEDGDYLTCNEWDGETQGSVEFIVAKNYLCRRTPFDGSSRTVRGEEISYTYSSDTEREADDGTNTEDQLVVPAYTADDEIFAMKPIAGGTGASYKVGGVDTAIEWLDLNADSRAWAKEF